jgi:hypothetical protein
MASEYVSVLVVGGFNFSSLRDSYVQGRLVDRSGVPVSSACQTRTTCSSMPQWQTLLNFTSYAGSEAAHACLIEAFIGSDCVGKCVVPLASMQIDDSDVLCRFSAFVAQKHEQWYTLNTDASVGAADLIPSMQQVRKSHCDRPVSGFDAGDGYQHLMALKVSPNLMQITRRGQQQPQHALGVGSQGSQDAGASMW